jgi:multicomponent Na+:H+ antiporter subunit D
MTTNYILVPILIHLITAILLIFFVNKITIQRIISTTGNVFNAITSLILFIDVWSFGAQTLHAGNWQPPFGITFVCDTLSATLVLLTSITGLAVGIFSTIGISFNRIKYGYFPIFHLLLMGLQGAFLTGDLFNLYVWFEVVIISSFVLITLGGKKIQMEGAIKYVAMNMFASTIFLTAIGLIYGLTGTLNMADLANKVPLIPNKGIVNVTALLFFVGFGIKAAVFPLYFWLPSSYHTPPSAIAAIFGGLLTKLGIYALIRMFTLIFTPDTYIQNIFLFTAIMTMFTGAFGMMNKKSIRKVFSYLIVCHIGYLMAGLALYTDRSLSGTIFYLIHDIIAKSNLFLIAGLIYKIRSSTDMRRLGGLYKDFPLLSILMLFVLLSISGVPPLSGFWPKINIISEALDAQRYVLVFSIIISSFVTLVMIAKVWAEVFWKPTPKDNPEQDDTFTPLSTFKKVTLILPVCLLAFASFMIAMKPGSVMNISDKIATEIMDSEKYIETVFRFKNTQK